MSNSKPKTLNPKIIFVLICFAAVVSGCVKKEEKITSAQAIPVKVEKIVFRDLDKTLEYVGNIKAQEEADIYPKVTGKIIEKVKEEGASVKKGDVVAYIDRDEVGLKYERAPVESPISGVIGRVYVDKGTNVNTSTPIALVVDMDQVIIDLDIPERYIPKIYIGQEADINVDAYPDVPFTGKVTKISPVVSLDTRSAPIEITIGNADHLLKSGMYARVGLAIESHKNVPVVIKEAILGKEPETYVYTIENEKAVLKKVALGLRQGPYYEIAEGIKEGDLVVIIGQQNLYEGAPVAISNGQEVK